MKDENVVPVFNPGEGVRIRHRYTGFPPGPIWTVIEQRYDREHIVIVRDDESTVRFFRAADLERVEARRTLRITTQREQQIEQAIRTLREIKAVEPDARVEVYEQAAADVLIDLFEDWRELRGLATIGE